MLNLGRVDGIRGGDRTNMATIMVDGAVVVIGEFHATNHFTANQARAIAYLLLEAAIVADNAGDGERPVNSTGA